VYSLRCAGPGGKGTTIDILNPWDTSQTFSDDPIDFVPGNQVKTYTSTFQDFAADFGLLGLDNYGDWRVLYVPGTASAAASG
jgi:hypothetical protein